MFWQAAIPILQLLAFSALATDCLQTAHWVEGTPDSPVLSPSGLPVYELNPVLAGHEEKREPYFRFLERVAEVAPKMLSPPVAAAVLAWIVLDDGRTVVDNNRLCKAAGFPSYVMLKMRWTW